jgi:hypothetical protein
MFIADYDTRFRHYIVEQTNEFASADAYIHYKLLLADKHFDRFNYALPTGTYDPRFYSKTRYSEIFSEMNRPRRLGDMYEKQAALNQIRMRIEDTKNRNLKVRAKFEQEAYEIAIGKGVFAS